ncbi:MAG: diacylglycerol kinase [Steroidobacteraceae bacterium]
MKNQAFHQRLGFAVAGLVAAFRNEHSFRFHTLAAVGVLGLLLYFKPAAAWWAILLLTVTTVLAAELFNTAMEHFADLLHPDQHPQIKLVKDCAAAAVLMTTLAALGVAVAFLYAMLS